MAASALHALGRADELAVRFADRPDVKVLRAMLDGGVRSPWTTSCGRLFDAACGLLGVRPVASYEGEAPMVLESLVTRPEVLEGAWQVEGGVLDLLPLLAALVGRDPVSGANVFHGTLAAALVAWALPVVQARSPGVVALSGGCFLNQVLLELVVEGFSRQGVEALVPRRVPANDGGVSLGQAYVAALEVGG
jgi:hydrogenase maturation protein HypF